MNASEFTWQHSAGRDEEGDKFSHDILLHGSGRILAKVVGPTGLDAYQHHVYFYCRIPDTVLHSSDNSLQFIDRDSAKQFAEKVLLQCDPFASTPQK